MSVLGMVEYTAIAVGIRASDAMVKAAHVDLIQSRPITPGKYMSLVTGDVASVQASVDAGIADAGTDQVIESFVIANLHEQVLPAILGKAPTPDMDAVGVIETTSVASIIEAADAACKASPVNLLRLHLALHIGGKGYTVFVGEVADVEAATRAGAEAAGKDLIEQVVIPNPYTEIYEHLRRDPPW